MRRLFCVGMLLGTGGWDSESELHYEIKKGIVVFQSSCGPDQTSCLKICVWQVLLGCEERDKGRRGIDHPEVILPLS